MHYDDIIPAGEPRRGVEESLQKARTVSDPHESSESTLYKVLKTELPAQSYDKGVQEIPVSDASALKTAASSGDVKTLAYFLERFGGLNQKTERAIQAALQLASSYGQYHAVCKLIETGIKVGSCVGSDGLTCLHVACQGGHADVVEQLLPHLDEVDVVDIRGQTAAHTAALNGELTCLKALHDRGASMNAVDKSGRQPVHLAAIRNHRTIIDFLYDCGVDLQSVDCHSRQPMHLAALHGALDCIVSLVERNCDVITSDAGGSLPLHHAAAKDHVDCVRFLIAQGTKPDVRQSQGKTPLHMAAENGAVNVVHWLLENGCNANIQDKTGKTPSHLAAMHGQGPAFSCLFQHAADLNKVDDGGNTPVDMARKNGHPILISKAMDGRVACPKCTVKQATISWNAAHPVPSSVLQVTAMASHCYLTPSTRKTSARTEREVTSAVSYKKPEPKKTVVSKSQTPTRSLAARYFGEYIDS